MNNGSMLIHRLLTLCLGLCIGILAAGGPSSGGEAFSPAKRASTATGPSCKPKPKVARKGPVLGRPPAPTEEQLLWMARTMYVESGTTYGMVRVGETILNRVRSAEHRSTVRGVTQKRWAYTGLTVNLLDVLSLGLDDYRSKRWQEAIRTAHAVLTMPRELRALPPDTRHYFAPGQLESKPDWARDELLVGRDGAHKFYAGVKSGTES